MAPEIEFYLVEPNTDPDYPLKPPVGRSGRPEIGRQGYSISAVNEFDALFEDIYKYSEQQGLEIDTLIHEDGAAQMEINLRHGDPLELADQVFLFKRTIREAALEHKIYATFMAKPIAARAGLGAMHIHQSIVDTETGENIFSDPETGDADAAVLRLHRRPAEIPAGDHVHAGALRELLPPADRARLGRRSTCSGATTTAPPACACRLPARRRAGWRTACPSSDANPYLAIAASLACRLSRHDRGARGHRAGRDATPTKRDIELPRGLLEAVALFEDCEPMRRDLRLAASSPTYRRDQEAGIRDLHAGDQPVGAGVSAAERVMMLPGPRVSPTLGDFDRSGQAQLVCRSSDRHLTTKVEGMPV